MDLVALAIARKNSGAGETTDFVKKTDIASTATAGIVKAYHDGGTQMMSTDKLAVLSATSNEIYLGSSQYKPIVPATLTEATICGLLRAATGRQRVTNDKKSYNKVEACSIMDLLHITNLVGPCEKDIADHAYRVGDIFINFDTVCRATSAINVGDVIVIGTNCESTSILELLKEALQS